jgi:DNA modification methylase
MAPAGRCDLVERINRWSSNPLTVWTPYFRKAHAKHPMLEKLNGMLAEFGRNRTNVWNYPGMNSFPRRGRTRGLDYHPTVKPIAMVSDAILDVTQLGGIVLDPFCGSGTTILAAEKTGRRGRGMDLDPRYLDTTIERWQRITGQAAVHASGKTFEEMRADRSAKIPERAL